MSLFEIVLIGKDLWTAIQAKDWAGILSAVGKLATAAAEFFKVTTMAATSEDDAASVDLDALLSEMQAPRVGVGADSAAIDPATIALIIQFAVMIFEAIRKRRQGG